MTNEHIDLERKIAAKKNEWIQARTAELRGVGSAEKTSQVNDELEALEEARKNQLESKENKPERQQEQNQQKNRVVRQMRMTLGR